MINDKMFENICLEKNIPVHPFCQPSGLFATLDGVSLGNPDVADRFEGDPIERLWDKVDRPERYLSVEYQANQYSSNSRLLKRHELTMFEQNFKWVVEKYNKMEGRGSDFARGRMFMVFHNMFSRPLHITPRDLIEMSTSAFADFMDATCLAAMRSGIEENSRNRLEVSYGKASYGMPTALEQVPTFIYFALPDFADSEATGLARNTVPFAFSPIPFLQILFERYRILTELGFSPLDTSNDARPEYWNMDIVAEYLMFCAKNQLFGIDRLNPLIRMTLGAKQWMQGIVRIPASWFWHDPVFRKTIVKLDGCPYGNMYNIPDAAGEVRRVIGKGPGYGLYSIVSNILSLFNGDSQEEGTPASIYGMPGETTEVGIAQYERLIHPLRPSFQFVGTRSKGIMLNIESQADRSGIDITPKLAFALDPDGTVYAVPDLVRQMNTDDDEGSDD